MDRRRRANRLAALLALVAWSGLLSGEAAAQQALVFSHADPSRPIGQAYLAHYGERCLAVLPTHVAVEAGSPQSFRREGAAGLLGEASEVRDLGDDLSVAVLVGGITRDCGYSLSSVSRAIDRRVAHASLAALRTVGGDGTLQQLSVAVVDNDGRRELRVQPTNSRDQITKGQSGSLLVVDEIPLGILLSVRRGYGRILRLDAALAAVDAEAARFGTSAPSGARPGGGGSAPRGAGMSVVSWSVPPVDAEHRAANLVAGSDALPWVADVAAWPVELEFDLPGERVALTGVVLDGTAVEDPGTLPAQVEIFFNASREGGRWRSLTGGAAEFADGRASLAFAPVWARQLKLVIAGARNGGGRVALGRVRVEAR